MIFTILVFEETEGVALSGGGGPMLRSPVSNRCIVIFTIRKNIVCLTTATAHWILEVVSAGSTGIFSCMYGP